MDSLTHIALGACIGEAFFERGFGKKAMWWGALAQSIPDIDFISSVWLNTSEALLAHRSFTHSILFAILIIPLFSLIAEKIHQPHNILYRKWLVFFFIEVFLHLFIDSFNNYGIGWLEPFSHLRFSFNLIYVADPFFSLVPVISLSMLIVLNRYNLKRKKYWKIGLLIPILYLTFCTVNKCYVDNYIEKKLLQQHLSTKKYFTTPAPFQNLLWYIVVASDSGFYIGYYSLLDKKDNVKFNFYPSNVSFLNQVSDHENLQRLKRFSQGYFTIEKWRDTLVFNDLRFGQITGWNSYPSKFVFHYYLQHPNDNKLIIQKGRFSSWNIYKFNSLIDRIKGI